MDVSDDDWGDEYLRLRVEKAVQQQCLEQMKREETELLRRVEKRMAVERQRVRYGQARSTGPSSRGSSVPHERPPAHPVSSTARGVDEIVLPLGHGPGKERDDRWRQYVPAKMQPYVAEHVSAAQSMRDANGDVDEDVVVVVMRSKSGDGQHGRTYPQGKQSNTPGTLRGAARTGDPQQPSWARRSSSSTASVYASPKDMERDNRFLHIMRDMYSEYEEEESNAPPLILPSTRDTVNDMSSASWDRGGSMSFNSSGHPGGFTTPLRPGLPPRSPPPKTGTEQRSRVQTSPPPFSRASQHSTAAAAPQGIVVRTRGRSPSAHLVHQLYASASQQMRTLSPQAKDMLSSYVLAKEEQRRMRALPPGDVGAPSSSSSPPPPRRRPISPAARPLRFVPVLAPVPWDGRANAAATHGSGGGGGGNASKPHATGSSVLGFGTSAARFGLLEVESPMQFYYGTRSNSPCNYSSIL